MAAVNTSRRFSYREIDRDNPFSQDGELSKKADFIIQNSSFDKKNLKVVDPDLEQGLGDISSDLKFTDLSYQESENARDQSFPVTLKKIEIDKSPSAEEIVIGKSRNKLKCCSLQ